MLYFISPCFGFIKKGKDMTYVMSDLHGMYDRFIAMLKKIDFSDSDELFIIGDIIDRGERPVDILEYVMDKPNITVLLGNHEVMARDFLRRLTAEITDENTASFDNDFLVELAIYKHNGGIPTINRLIALPPDKQQRVLDFIDSLYAYEAIDIGDSTFVLVHAGLGNFRKDKKISEYSLYELLELRPDYERQYFAAAFFLGIYSELTKLISGKWEIYHSHNNIVIDCGAAFGGRLACLRLEDMTEFYV